MRRALLLLALATPAAASAQTTTTNATITFTEGTTDLVHGEWISLAECAAAKAHASDTTKPDATVNVTWRLTGFPNGGSYQLYASTAEITGDKCPTANATTPTQFNAGPVGSNLGNLGANVTLRPVSIADIFKAITLADCAAVSGDTPIFVCAQSLDASGTATTAIATGKITLSIAAPLAPTNVQAVPADDGALKVTWNQPTTVPAAYDYRIQLTSAADPNAHDASGFTALDYTMKGLVNDATYNVSVWSRSKAGNESQPGTGTGTAKAVLNFWDVYHEAPPVGFGGVEQGGCGAGAGGPLSLALLSLAALGARLRSRA